MNSLKQLLIILNLKTLIITGLAIISTYLCITFDITADFPLTLIATAVVFPIVFSISGAYKRREDALTKYSSIKSHGRALYFATRDWLEPANLEALENVKTLLGEVLAGCRKMFTESLKNMPANEEEIYKVFSKLSIFIKNDLRQNGLSSGEVSRCNQFLSKMLLAFEDVKHIYQYRTPRTLAAFSDFFVTILPIVYGPYFASLVADYSNVTLVYVMPVLFAMVLVSLDNIQSHLENPFDQVGEDDILINAEKFVARLEL
ncbi:MAG: hypothetical protein JXA13_04145 [Anaerolineales bacterium]|nr:hypothetical protein [Anaerolineales bacterium]